ncbi:MAG: NifB/NifX family molybdenum-iron cluster-binding protein [Desulfobacteraceae bacterium]|nr:NifB/NifX family molybdenum-iron cluster-binding protein [Desulfobacteraceae bacterium]
MKVAVSSAGKDLDSQIDPRFGRCAYFIIVDMDTMGYEVFDNENIALGGGAGIQSAQFVASKDAKVVITGNCGPNAVRTLSAAGVEVIVGQTGTVRRAVDDYKAGNLKATNAPNVADHYGMDSGAAQGKDVPQNLGIGMGRGTGMGRGMGRGGGMGCRRGMMGSGMAGASGMGVSASAFPDASVFTARDQEVELLRNQLGDLQEQIEVLKARIEDSDPVSKNRSTEPATQK